MISGETAEVFALLPNGSGGGQQHQRIQQALSELHRVMAVMILLATVVGSAGALFTMGAPRLPSWQPTDKILACLQAAASMSLLLMDASGIEPVLRKALASMVCEAAKTIGLGVFGNADTMGSRAVTIFSGTEGTVGMLGGGPLVSCPI